MSQNFKKVLEAIKKTKLDVKVLDKEQSEKYISMLIDKYVDCKCKSYIRNSIWEVKRNLIWEADFIDDIEESCFQLNEDYRFVFRYIGDYVRDREEVYYITDDKYDKKDRAVFIVKGKDAKELMEESDVADIYVSDKEGSFLLSLNHHDVLMGIGAASDWVKQLKKKLKED